MDEISYPIFFPMYHPTATGYYKEWLWYDPDIEPEDQGPFGCREETVADWSLEALSAALLAEARALDNCLALPMLQGGTTAPNAQSLAEQGIWAGQLDQGLAITQALDAAADPLVRFAC